MEVTKEWSAQLNRKDLPIVSGRILWKETKEFDFLYCVPESDSSKTLFVSTKPELQLYQRKEAPLELKLKNEKNHYIFITFKETKTCDDFKNWYNSVVPLQEIVITQATKYLKTHLSNPTRVYQITSPNDKFVIFQVDTISNLPNFKGCKVVDNTYRCQVRKRFKEFTVLKESLHKAYPIANIPELPTTTYTNKFGIEFLEKRQESLKVFLQLICENKLLMESEVLKKFLTIDDIGKTEVDKSDTSQVVSNLEHYFGRLEMSYLSPQTINQSNFATQAEKDLNKLQELSVSWKVDTIEIPFEKFVILILGTTSSGKSSWINHFFGVNVKKTADCQQDTFFTLIEVVGVEEFIKYTPSHSKTFANFSTQELQENITNIDSDPRLNNVYVYLDPNSTIQRYRKHFTKYTKDITTFHLFKTVLINEHYLLQHPSFAFCSKTIIIDSPGFIAEKDFMNNVEEMACNLNIYQSLYSLCDKLLFFMPASQIQMTYNQLVTLELTILASLPDVGVHNIVSRLEQAKKKSYHNEEGFCSYYSTFITSLFSTQQKAIFKGTTCWEKTLFILSKIDLLETKIETNTNRSPVMTIFYDLAGIFSSAFSIFPNPVCDSILTISLPSKSMRKVENDIFVLHDKLHSLSLQTPYEKRIESTIQIMANNLLGVIQSSLYYYSNISTCNEIKEISQNSIKRINF